MNFLHMKYAVEVAKTSSINKASEKLYVGQSNLSRAIKELEADLGFDIFERSAKGVKLTPDGEVFIRYAKNILKEVETVRNMFSGEEVKKKRFAVSVSRASYITEALTEFSKELGREEAVEIFYKETNSHRTIKNIVDDGYNLGIIRFAENYTKYYMAMLEEKNLTYDILAEFKYVLVMSKDSELAKKEKITYDDLKDYIEIAHADPYVPTLPFAEVRKEELPDNSKRRILVFERASQFELLSQNPECFMWVSPIPKELMERYGLTLRSCEENNRIYKEAIIHRKDYVLSRFDKLFIEKLIESKNKNL